MEWSSMDFQSVRIEAIGQEKEVEERGRTCDGMLAIPRLKRTRVVARNWINQGYST
jgi:hypothetical protein